MTDLIIDKKMLYPRKGKGFKWTVKELESIESSYEGYKVSDSDGLFGNVRVLKSGKVSIDFKYSFKWEKKQSWFACGTFPKHELSEIRNQRDWAKKQLSAGINPCLQKRTNVIKHQEEQRQLLKEAESEKLKNLTFKDLFDEWIEHGISRENNNIAIKSDFKKHVLPVIGNKRISDLTTPTLKKIFETIKKNATPKQPRNRTVQKIHDELQQVFKWALDNKHWNRLLEYQNPLSHLNLKAFIDKGYSDVRERYLSESEISQLARLIQIEKDAYIASTNKRKTLKPLNEKIEIAIWLCLSTMCRIGELVKARWCEIDFENGIWTIPPENIKSTNAQSRQHIIYLSPFAISKFNQLRNITENSEWCFPSEKDITKPVYEKSYSKVIGDRQIQFSERNKPSSQRRHDNSLVIGTEKWTLHDLRRTGATIMQQLGVSTDIIDLCQNHEIRTKVRRAYQQFEYSEQKKEAWLKLGNHLESILSRTTNKDT